MTNVAGSGGLINSSYQLHIAPASSGNAESGIATLPTEAACLHLGEAREIMPPSKGGAMMIRGGLVIIVGLLVPFTAHAAGQQFKTSEQVWKLSDKCTADALKKYPDYTREGLEKREQHIKQCNLANRTPSRQSLTATAPPAPLQ